MRGTIETLWLPCGCTNSTSAIQQMKSTQRPQFHLKVQPLTSLTVMTIFNVSPQWNSLKEATANNLDFLWNSESNTKAVDTVCRKKASAEPQCRKWKGRADETQCRGQRRKVTEPHPSHPAHKLLHFGVLSRTQGMLRTNATLKS
jgi:hypothetical protein